jgi:hypothetical protein
LPSILDDIAGAADVFPPIEVGALRIDEYALGPIRFDDVLLPQGDGSLATSAHLGNFDANGRLVIPGLNIRVTTDYDNPLFNCSIEVRPQDSSRSVRIRTELAVDNSLAESDRTFGELTGVAAKTTTAFNPRFCVQIREPNTGALISGPTVDALFLQFPGLLTLISQVVNGVATELISGGSLVSPGPIGGFDRVVGNVAVDAFTNVRYRPFRTEEYFAITTFEPPAYLDEPQWITVDATGATHLGLRRELLPGPGLPP